MPPNKPEKIEPRFVERVWGSFQLEPWFPNQPVKTGEVWFEAGRLLIKFLFTTEALSVQVHPEDSYAKQHHNSAGKTEMWYILRAEPSARIAAGFARPVSRDEARAAALDGSIEQLLGWHQASAGDTFFTRARTVHALGAGLVVLEIQQTSDITYRLYDYGRGRELHLDHGFAVAELGPHPGRSVTEAIPGTRRGERLAGCEYFVTERWTLQGPAEAASWDRDSVVIPIEGSGLIGGEHRFSAGDVWRVPAGTPVAAGTGGRCVVVRTFEPNAQ